MKKHSSFCEQRESSRKLTQCDSREVMSELVLRLRKQLDGERVVAPGDKDVPDAEKPNLDGLTVGVDLGDQWSNYCILGIGGETLAEGQFRMRRQEVGEFFQGRVARSDGSGDAFGVGAS